ncbi:hypothetical protein [Deinococcus frigens]|uniref:hypothetical protein n=1 Tax=Deinococcus frigens TaxID=249403 RepID=UPI000AD3FEC6|nr:hypothetical protein [Deinococcus frigens]
MKPANLRQRAESGTKKDQWQVRASVQSTPRDPNTGFNTNNQPAPLRGQSTHFC